MHGEAPERAAITGDRVEVILHEMDALPTLGAVAVRLLELTADADADANEVIGLVASDPALASRVLVMCRCHDRGRASQVTTVERAVLMLGFEAVRSAVLSVQVFELMDGLAAPSGEMRSARPVFDREAFWIHAMAVAVAGERIAAALEADGPRPGEAFVAGLLHDIGQLVLHVLLPETFDQVCRVAETHTTSLDHACRQLIGLDTHTVGKRVAEHWNLPQSLIDVIWLNGQPHEALPPVPHRPLIAVISLADALVRSRYINPGAHWAVSDSVIRMGDPVGLRPQALELVCANLHEEVAGRAAALGICERHDPLMLLRAIWRANESLARANDGMRQRERHVERQARMLKALADFHDAVPRRNSLIEVLQRIAHSAGEVFGAEVFAVVHESLDAREWRVVPVGPDRRPSDSHLVERPGGVRLASILRDVRGIVPAATVLPSVTEWIDERHPPGALLLFPITCGDAGNAVVVLLPDEDAVDRAADTEGLVRAWRAAVASGVQHDRFATLTEQLAESNRAVLDAQDELARRRALGTLGEVAAGAAHEMNNPLTIISGRSQILADRVEDPAHREAAREIVTQAHKLSDMITALRSFAEPVEPKRRKTDLAELIVRVVQVVAPHRRRQVQVNTIFAEALPPVSVDAALLGAAIEELLRNAVESKGSQYIELRVQTDTPDGRLKIEVRDDGEGLDQHTMKHAFDPFFSARPAGRQPGLGLARARRFVEAHGGTLTLVNAPGGGAVATMWLEDWRAAEQTQRPAA
jgi:signal transduction histidine kinase/HD-like signal output (HDOD) protein